MSDLGAAFFYPPFVPPFDKPFFDGSYFVGKMSAPVSWEPANNVIILPTLAGGAIVQQLYTGAKGPSIHQAYPFQLQWIVGHQEDYERLLAAKAHGRPVSLFVGYTACDMFLAQSGSTYTLSRPIAVGVVTGLTDPPYSVRLLLDGVLTPSCATVSGQTVTAAATGEITVLYPPVHYVIVTTLKHKYTSVNNLQIDATLQEVIQGSFD